MIYVPGENVEMLILFVVAGLLSRKISLPEMSVISKVISPEINCGIKNSISSPAGLGYT